jgi:stage III sporulation protein AG
VRCMKEIKEMLDFSGQNKLKVLLAAGALGIALMAVSAWWSGSLSDSTDSTEKSGLGSVVAVTAQAPNQGSDLMLPGTADNSEAVVLENRLAAVLSQIDGIGQVKVSISLAAGTQKVFATNQKSNRRDITERDERGGTRTTAENTEDEELVLLQSSGQNPGQPLLVQEVNPQISGVLVVAEGAGDARVREELTQTVQVVLNVPAHKIRVMPKVKGGD